MSRIKNRKYTMALGLFATASFKMATAATYTVVNTNDSGTGSLRQAVLDANLTPIADEIHFAIPGAGVKTISLLSQLSAITSSLTIDGFTQPGASANTLNTNEGGLNTVLQIELTGSGGFYGFYTDTNNGVILTVQGLNMHGFSGCLLGAASAGTSQVRSFGNYLCSNIEGSAIAAGAATGFGVSAQRSASFIGGDLPSQRNLISACDSHGVRVDGNAQIRGNLIGTDSSAMLALGNGFNSNLPGVMIYNTEATITIGGAESTSRNLISGNHTFGIGIRNQSANTHYANIKILGNYIGTNWQGTQALPNGYATPNFAAFGGGIQIDSTTTDPTPLIIGGFGTGEGNLIAFNHGSGISSRDNSVGEGFDSQGNSIHSHTFGGATNLDLGEFGFTANDVGDADLGVNGQQNSPDILLVTEFGNQATVQYQVDTLSTHATYPLRVDFYIGLNGGSGVWLAQDNIPIAEAGMVREYSFTLPIGVRAFPITAIASSANHSSELSPVYDRLFLNGFE